MRLQPKEETQLKIFSNTFNIILEGLKLGLTLYFDLNILLSLEFQIINFKCLIPFLNIILPQEEILNRN